jgi:hypothetical protein
MLETPTSLLLFVIATLVGVATGGIHLGFWVAGILFIQAAQTWIILAFTQWRIRQELDRWMLLRSRKRG